MNVLGIETSCDETSAAVVKDGEWILSNLVVSSLNEHQKYGGVIPEIASRRQLEYITPIIRQSLKEAGLPLSKIDAIAVTSHPGLVGSLLVGLSFARALSASLEIPLAEVDHIKAHIYANFLRKKNAPVRLTPQNAGFPCVGLVVSGGHTSLFLLKAADRFEEIGHTLDDAAGEAFDKVARILELGYPGGPVIDKLASTVPMTKLKFAPAKLLDSYDFSFSGVKTAVLYHERDEQKRQKYSKAETAYAFQKSVIENLIDKSLKAMAHFHAKTLLIGGGVAANSYLRRRLDEVSQEHDLNIFYPPLNLCIDNAAMIAGLGFYQLKPR